MQLRPLLFLMGFALLPLGFSSSLASDSDDGGVTLKCIAEDGTPVSDLAIDFQNKTMKWGQSSVYSITSMNDRYISAYQNTYGEVGGETWVLDRITGKYIRAAVELFCGSDCTSSKLGSAVYRGICSKGAF